MSYELFVPSLKLSLCVGICPRSKEVAPDCRKAWAVGESCSRDTRYTYTMYNIQFVIFNLRGDLWWYSDVAYVFEHDMQHMFRIKNSCVIIKSLSHDYPLIKYHKTFYTIFPLKIHRFGPSLFRAWPVVYQTKVKGWNRRTLYEPLTMVHIVIYRLYNIVFLSFT